MKALKWLVVLVVLVAVAAAAYLLLPRKEATPSGASLLPPDTFLFVRVPDVARAKQEWNTTAIHKIWSEPEVQALVSNGVTAARQQFDAQVAGSPYMELLRRSLELPRGEFFFAVTEMGGVQQLPKMALGFDVKDRRVQTEQWLRDAKTRLESAVGSVQEESKRHRESAYTSWSAREFSIHHAFFGSLLVAASHEDTLKAMIDRMKDGASVPTLARDARYENAAARMPGGHALLAYCNPTPLVNLLKIFALTMPQLQEGLKNASAIESVSFSTTMENGSFRDVVFVRAPAAKRPATTAESAPTQRKTLALTTDKTLFHMTQHQDLAKLWGSLAQQMQLAPDARVQEWLFALDKFNRQHGLNLPKDLLDALGPEYGVALDWGDGQPVPELTFGIEVRDRAKAQATIDKLMGVAHTNLGEFASAVITTLDHEGLRIQTLRMPLLPISPSFTLHDRFFLFSLQADSARRVVSNLKGSSASLAQNALYQQTMNSLPAGGSSYTYLDAKALFEHVYDALLNLARTQPGVGAAVSGYVDLAKLPPAQTISRHLQPMASAQVTDNDGYTTVMISPVGMPTFMAVGLVGAGVAVAERFPELMPR